MDHFELSLQALLWERLRYKLMRHCAIPPCGAEMKNGRCEASWVDEAEALPAIMDDDW